MVRVRPQQDLVWKKSRDKGCWSRGEAHRSTRVGPVHQSGHNQAVKGQAAEKSPENNRSPCCDQRGEGPAQGVQPVPEPRLLVVPANPVCLHDVSHTEVDQ